GEDRDPERQEQAATADPGPPAHAHPAAILDVVAPALALEAHDVSSREPAIRASGWPIRIIGRVAAARKHRMRLAGGRPATLSYLSAGGCRLEYVWHGPGPDAAPTLVFLHEGLGCVTRWRDFPEELATAVGCGALVYSRGGYGGSDRNPPPWGPRFLHREALVVLPEVLDAAGVRRAVLVGHSDGGSIALIYAPAVVPTAGAGAGQPPPHGPGPPAPPPFFPDPPPPRLPAPPPAPPRPRP